MFVAKFVQTSGSPFTADKNGNFPFIGEVLAGSAKGTLINGTMFIREGYEANTLYACENTVDPEYPDNQQVQVISKVSIVDYLGLRTHLGAGKLIKAEGVESSISIADMKQALIKAGELTATKAGKLSDAEVKALYADLPQESLV